jgi:hypothetical protein
MTTRIPLLLIVAAATLAGCQQNNDDEPFTFADTEVQRVVLYDVRTSGMGGSNLYLTREGEAWVQMVQPAAEYFDEQRYRFQLGDDQLERILRAVSEDDLAALAVRRRPAVPDGSNAVIGVTLSTGEQIMVRRKATSPPLPAFDRPYLLLKDAALNAPKTEPLYEGRFQWRWRPEGFEPQTRPES